MQYIYILKTGETFPNIKNKLGDFDEWIINFLGKTKQNIKVIDVLHNEELPSFDTAIGFIITGSHCMVSEELPWSVNLEKYIQKIKEENIPLLGICYGHQLIAKALGGKSGFNPNGIEIGRARIKGNSSAQNDPLFKNFQKYFYAFETHYQSALKLPPKAVVLASTHKEKHQAVRFSSSIWGVQFHPEFDKNAMREYILGQEDKLIDMGFDTKKLIKNAKSCDISNTILTNFLKVINSNLH